MRIVNNNQGILQLFSRMNGNRTNANKPFGNTASSRHFGIGGRNTLEDLLSGHYKNSYGVEGMVITEGSNRKRIMPVSNEMKQHVFNDVKDKFYKYYGMSGDNESEQREHYGKINEYLKTVKKENRSATSWTLGQMHLGITQAVTKAIKAKIPSWEVGKSVSKEILDEVFADEKITSMESGKSGDTKGFDIQI